MLLREWPWGLIFRGESPSFLFHFIEVYTIDRICQLKTGAYQRRDKIRDLYDICFICDRYFADLSESTKEQLKDALTYKGFDYFDYVTSTQDDALIDKDTLAGLYLNMFEKLNLLYSEEEAKTLSAKETDAEKEDDEQEDWRRWNRRAENLMPQFFP